jgi:hypothetical protein
MSAAEAYGGKPFTVNSLEPTALYKLLVAPSTPPESREEIDRRFAAGEIVSAVTIALKEGFNGYGAVVSYLNNVQPTKQTIVKLTAIALASAFALSSTGAFAQPVRPRSDVRTHSMYRDTAPPVFLHPNYGNPNGDRDGPTTLSGTGSSQFGGSSPGTSGYN